MQGKYTKQNGFKKIIFSSIIMLGILFALTILYNSPLLACEGVAQPGHHVVMKMIDPSTGDLFATITFEDVISGGKSKMTESKDDLPLPSSYALPTKPAYYDIVTNADYSGDVEVCMNYSAIGLKTRASALRVAHLTNGAWEELKTTIDTDKNIVCGIAPSLSHFVVYEDPRYLYGPILYFQNF